MTEEKIVYIDPVNIIRQKNSRFGLKPSRVSQLAEDILERGSVLEAIAVTKTKDGKYVLVYGNYRHAAVE